MQFTSPSRRAFGILAAGTIGLSTALLGVMGVAQADPADSSTVAATVPAGPDAPTQIDVYGADHQLNVYFADDQMAVDAAVTDSWEYQLTSTAAPGTPPAGRPSPRRTSPA